MARDCRRRRNRRTPSGGAARRISSIPEPARSRPPRAGDPTTSLPRRPLYPRPELAALAEEVVIGVHQQDRSSRGIVAHGDLLLSSDRWRTIGLRLGRVTRPKYSLYAAAPLR